MKRRDLIKLGGMAGAAAMLAKGSIAKSLAADMKDAKADKPLKILILGGTGFIGPHQVRHALARGHQVTLFNRGKQTIEWDGEVEQLIGDRNTGDLSALKDREWDVCIDNPTTLPKWARDAGVALRGKVKQYIFISTISVYSDNSVVGANERAGVNVYAGKDAMAETQDTVRANPALYGALKALSEAEVTRHFGDKCTIIRPGLIVGPGDPTDRFSYWPQRIARGGDIAAPGDGLDPVQIIDVRDLDEWIIHVAEQRTFGVFNAVGPREPLTMGGMLGGIAMAIDSRPRLHWIPAWFLKAQNVNPWSDMPAWLPREGESAGFASRSNDKAIAAGLTFRPLAATARDTLAWFNTLPADRRNRPLAGLDEAREEKLLDAWRMETAVPAIP